MKKTRTYINVIFLIKTHSKKRWKATQKIFEESTIAEHILYIYSDACLPVPCAWNWNYLHVYHCGTLCLLYCLVDSLFFMMKSSGSGWWVQMETVSAVFNVSEENELLILRAVVLFMWPSSCERLREPFRCTLLLMFIIFNKSYLRYYGLLMFLIVGVC